MTIKTTMAGALTLACAATQAHADVIKVRPGESITDAIRGARGGDVIELQRGATYTERVTLKDRTFTADRPLVIRSAPGEGAPATIRGDTVQKGTVLTIEDSAYVLVDDVAFRRALKGIKVYRSDHVTLNDADLGDLGQEALSIRFRSRYVDVLDCRIRGTGKRTPKYGEGVYIGAKGASDSGETEDDTSHVWVEGCDISETGQGEGVDISGTARHVMIKDNFIHDIVPGSADKVNPGLIAMAQQDEKRSNNAGAPSYDAAPRDVWIVGNTLRRQRASTSPYNVAAIYVFANGVNVVGNDIDESDDFAIVAREFKDSRFGVRIWQNVLGPDIGKSPAIKRSNTAKQVFADPGEPGFARQTWYDALIGGGGEEGRAPTTGEAVPVALDAWTASAVQGAQLYEGWGIGYLDAHDGADTVTYTDVDLGPEGVGSVSFRYATLSEPYVFEVQRRAGDGWRTIGRADLPATTGWDAFAWSEPAALSEPLTGKADVRLRVAEGWGGNLRALRFDPALAPAPGPAGVPDEAPAQAFEVAADEAVQAVGARIIDGYGVAGFDGKDGEDQFRFRNLDFGEGGYETLRFRYAADTSPQAVKVYVKDEAGDGRWTRIATLQLPLTGGWNDFVWAEAPLREGVALRGRKTIVFESDAGGSSNVKAIAFE